MNTETNKNEPYIVNTQYGYFVSPKKLDFGINNIKPSPSLAYVLHKMCLILTKWLYKDQETNHVNDDVFIKDAVDNNCDLNIWEEGKLPFPSFKELNDAINFRNVLNAKIILNRFR